MTSEDEQAIRARAEAGTTQHCDTEILRADVRTLLEALDKIRAELELEKQANRINYLENKQYVEHLTQQRDELAAALESARASITVTAFSRQVRERALADIADPGAILRERDGRVTAELKQQLAASQAREKELREAMQFHADGSEDEGEAPCPECKRLLFNHSVRRSMEVGSGIPQLKQRIGALEAELAKAKWDTQRLDRLAESGLDLMAWYDDDLGHRVWRVENNRARGSIREAIDDAFAHSKEAPGV